MSSNITERDAEIIKAVFQVMKAEIDYAEVAKLCSMKSAKYARDQWAVVRKRLLGTNAAATTGDTPKKATPRKRKAADADGGEVGGTKKRKQKQDTPAPSEAATPATGQDEREENEDVSIKEEEPNEAGEFMDALG